MSSYRRGAVYHVSRAGREIFRLDAASLAQHFKSGQVLPTDLYWCAGMSTWLPISGLSSLQGVSPSGLGTSVGSSGPSGAISSSLGLAQAAAPSHLPPRPAQPPERCPHCNSKTIKTARAIYLAGTRDSTGSGMSYGWGRNWSPRSYSSTRTSRSRLAAQLAPPDEAGCGMTSIMMLLILVGLVATLAGAFTTSRWFIVLAAALGYGLYRFCKSDMAQQEAQGVSARMEEYERTWYCSKCATKFIW